MIDPQAMHRATRARIDTVREDLEAADRAAPTANYFASHYELDRVMAQLWEQFHAWAGRSIDLIGQDRAALDKWSTTGVYLTVIARKVRAGYLETVGEAADSAAVDVIDSLADAAEVAGDAVKGTRDLLIVALFAAVFLFLLVR